VTVREVGIEEGIRLRDAGYRVVDVREPHEWAAGHIAGATHIPLGDLAARAPIELADRAAPLLLQCHSGARSGRAATWLQAQGYTDVVNLAALIDRWQPAGGAWDAPGPGLTPDQARRYARQVRLPEIGVEGQRRLLDASAVLIGAGGLGSSAALYLAAAGVGRIAIVDDDEIDLSNLHRQVIHATDRLGQPKADSAALAIRALNPDVRVVARRERLDADNAERLIAGAGVVVDGSDTLETRYAVNDAAVRLRVPVVHASIYRWEARITTLVPFEGPCYRCLHPTAAPDDLVAACDVVGVLGTVPGVAGVLQATEAIKVLLGIGASLAGRQLIVDLREMAVEEIRSQRDPACPVCGDAVLASGVRGG
jgi:molybdopterin/thiamine biosynthesis adenylyltransferase/rhodanese-related sulfurtransferase